MSKQSDADLADYVEFVRKLWVVKSFPNTFADDLIPVMMEAGFIIDTVRDSISGETCVVWSGLCFDEEMVNYKFTATWAINMDKFTQSVVHYYDLVDLCIEPLEQ